MSAEREGRTETEPAAPTQAPGATIVPAAFEPGARIRQYEIIRPLGRGGMGTVYLARDVRLGRRVAIKVVLARSATLTRDFLREARATASCQHENIVVIHEADEHEGTPYMVLEHLEGRNLRQAVGGRKVAPGRAVELMVPVVRALVCAHERNIVHRDLKPENVFVTSGGGVKVLDFGIAALIADADLQTAGRSRMQARIGGTMAYMATEQFEPGGADHRSDLWAVGIMLYELLTGHHPVQPLTQEALLRHAYFLDDPYPRIRDELPDLPHRLADLVDRCLEKKKERRLASAAELLAALEPLLPGRNVRAIDAATGPYPGLAAFQEVDADRFFGRGADVLQVVTGLRDHAVAAIVGASGVGKSSFVRAGVVPPLAAPPETWKRLFVGPAADRFRGLRAVSRRSSRRGTVSCPRTGTGNWCRSCASRPATWVRSCARAPPSAGSTSCCVWISSRSCTRWCPTCASDWRSPPACRARPTTPPRRCACSYRSAPTSSIGWARIAGSSTTSCAGSISSSRCRATRCGRRWRRRSPSSVTASRARNC